MRASLKLAIECSPTMATMAARRYRISTYMCLVDAILAAWFAAFRPKPRGLICVIFLALAVKGASAQWAYLLT